MVETPGGAEGISADLFHLMVDSVRDYALFMLSPTGRIITWNAGAQRIKGYQAAEVIGRHFSVFYPAAEVRAGKPDYELRVAQEVGRFEDEGWRIRKDGTRFWANVVISAVRDATGTLVGFAKVTRDLSERKRAEDERSILLEAEREARTHAEAAWARLEALQAVTETGLAHVGLPALADALAERTQRVFAADGVGILVSDGDGFRTLAARSDASEASRQSAEEVVEGLSRRVRDSGAPLMVQEGVQDEAEPGLFGSWLALPLLSDGEAFGVLYVSSSLPGRFREDDLALLQMIGARVALALDHARAVEAEQEARAQMLAARESAQLRNEFIAVAAHELKTPLTSIRVAAQMAARSLGDGNPGARTLIEQVVAQSGRLNRLVAALLDSSRADLGRLEMQPVETDVASVVAEVVAATSQTSEREVVLQADAPLRAEVDALRFEQVTMNLLDNALKYSPADSPVEVGLTTDADSFTLAVRDHGPGIPVASRRLIFERFFQGHLDTHPSGLGLGLYISREIVKAHGGRIEAAFPKDGGSLFTVRMPLAYRPPTERPDSARAL